VLKAALRKQARFHIRKLCWHICKFRYQLGDNTTIKNHQILKVQLSAE